MQVTDICLLDKKAMLSFTTGSQQSMFSANGIHGDMNVTLWPLQNGILHYCGFQVLDPQIFWAPSSATCEARKSMLDEWRTRLDKLFDEKPFSFPPMDFFEKETGFLLKPDVAEKLTVGLHLGKPLPCNQMKHEV
uniref:NAD(P)H dehydrogenase, quinone 1 n=1 Tax=Stegastes partitus TaxID=144197 RepID=A0A3B5A7H1_9TELE